MARYILLEVPDDKLADNLLAKLRPLESRGVKLRGIFQKPRKYCECGPLTDTEQMRECTRGAKYGWIVHIPCRRPRKGTHNPRNLVEGDQSWMFIDDNKEAVGNHMVGGL